ncbi:MAG TPA: hypothetical protein PK400_13315 [Phycisphaerales bacterium]|nr:hypothetical protein [Phycisphaerales bacterium]HRQ76697.1 hypothetical protein [Phycisphaerales bacterium]
MMCTARFRSVLAAGVLAISLAGSAGAASDAMQHLDNFVHYTQIARPDLAAAAARKLLDSGITDAELVTLLDEGRVTPERFDAAISRAQFMPQLESVAGELTTRMEKGRMDLARDQNRIDEAVRMLIGTQRERLLAQRRLQSAGEYAVPALLRQITEGRDQSLRMAAQDMVRRLGPQAVMPLCVALPHVGDATAQRIVCDILGDLGYPHAAPFLLEASMDAKTSQPVREAALRAFNRLPVPPREGGASGLYAHLARQYFERTGSLIAFPNEPTNNIWSYDPFIGLTPTAVETDIFPQVMSMMLSRRALQLDAGNQQALSLFVAANLRRENDMPPGGVDPIFGESAYTPAFYATVFGTATCMDVLAMALDAQDTPLIRDAIEALAKTTGGSNLLSHGMGRQPLVEAVYYPDRRVQYEAALTLGRALPKQGFSGDYSIVPLLASAVRAGGQLFALIVADDEEDRTILGSRLNDLGFDVIGSESSIAGVRDAIDHAVGIDLVLVQMRTADRARQAVSDLRSVPATSVVPVLVLAEPVDLPSLRLEYRDVTTVEPTRRGLSPQVLSSAIDGLMIRATGGRMTEAEAEGYAIEAIDTLRDIAVAGSNVYEIADAETALIEALSTRTGGVLMLVADVVAMIDSDRAQRRLFDAALAATDYDQVDLLIRVAASVKRFGNRAEERHVNALLDLVANSEGRTAEAAAEVHGALNLPATAAVRLITN